MSGRALTLEELALARAVFGDAIDAASVRLRPGGFGRFAVTLGSTIYLPAELARSDFARAGPFSQAFLVHELVHVWQWRARPLRTLASWCRAALTGGYGPGLPAYRYTLPVGDFGRLGLERQASVVEHLFLLRRGVRSSSMPPDAQLRDLDLTPFPIGV
jgi:hypothetical protein